MTRPVQSQYIRVTQNNALLKQWIAKLILAIDLEDYLVFERIERRILCAFRTAELTRENQEDADFIRAWLETELATCDGSSFDETDVFSVNTRRIKELVGLNETELDILRFAILLNSCRPLEMVADIHSDGLSEIDLCDLLHDILGDSFDALYNALNPKGRLIKSGLLKSRAERGGTGSLTGWLRVPEILLQQMYRVQNDNDSLEYLFYLKAPRSKLAQKGFRHLEPNVRLLKDYLKASCKSEAKGANILLWGPPGTGKTELARYLAQSTRKQGLEINTCKETGDALNSTMRFDSYLLCQAIVGRSRHALVIYDEVEEILSDSSYADHGFKRTGFVTKGTINTALESNRAPAIWITNTLRGVDPAYLRRFDLVLRVKMPATKTRKRIANNVFKDLPVSKEMVNQIAEHQAITPAHLQKVSKICARLGIDTGPEAQAVVQQVLNSDLEAIHAAPLKEKENKVEKKPELAYKPGLINSDLDLKQLAAYLEPDSAARICLYGPPGTGKTAWGHYLAKTIKQPLLVKRAADILDAYIGNTEKNIAAAFAEASANKSVLLLDEVDSFLQDRSRAHRHWEVAQVNQFLTSMENYDGLLICTTNLMGSLDPATLRRFDFKVGFDYLTVNQAMQMTLNFLSILGVKPTREEKQNLIAELEKLELSHGDFAALLRRYRVIRTAPDTDTLIVDLLLETGFRKQDSLRPIGFVTGASTRNQA